MVRKLNVSGITIHSVFGPDGNRIAEYNEATGALIRQYVWLGDRPVAVIEGPNVYLVRADHIGRLAFTTTMAGAVVWTASYLPFGGVTVTTGTPIDLRFPGQWFQAEAGLYQNWMRDYDPALGRYLESDPLGLVDGASLYGYALQNPGRWVDKSGGQVYKNSYVGFQLFAIRSTPYESSGEPFVTHSQLPPEAQKVLAGRVTWGDEIYTITFPGCQMMKDPSGKSDAIFFSPPGQNPFDRRKESRANSVRYMPPGTGSGQPGGKYSSRYPQGYYVYYNSNGEVVSPYSGRAVSERSSEGHTPALTHPILINP
ncbi:MAG: hypothetical protein DI533_17185 [Cereibacter sphaeroides]|uniref:RHS repeat-associated core domain-containing protein n=1 Tax=Cereibacter sphaeroides TaxID=1063 RepID=A0A2W5UDT6_CERSP|nr:MAG: hypothetical protein DI533_17185 [Cereibacter sphaeroides]